MSCDHPDTEVLDSRPTSVIISSKTVSAIRRKRRCLVCQETWITIEAPEDIIVARDKAKALRASKAQAKLRGFVVPKELEKEYQNLRRDKHMGSRAAAEAIGIMDRDGRVKEEYKP